MTALLAGLGLGFSLIVAIGAQNLFVLRQGLRREHIVPVIIVCAVSDAVLVVVGIAGLGVVLQRIPWLETVVRWLGFAFLVGYGLMAAWRAFKPKGGLVTANQQQDAPAVSTVRSRSRRMTVVLTALALTWLNPHVYLDTVFLLGSIANGYGDQRWLFAAGAVTASVVWFTVLGLGAGRLGTVLSSPRVWRWLDAVIAVVMITLGVLLVVPVQG